MAKTSSNRHLILNIVPLAVAGEPVVTVGVQPYADEALHALRQKHGDRIFFRRDRQNERIIAIALENGVQPPGTETDTYDLRETPWLLAPLTLEALLRLFRRLGRPVLAHRPLRVLAERRRDMFPSGCGLPDWVQRRVAMEFDTRTLHTDQSKSVVVLGADAKVRNVLDASCSDLLEAGISPIDRYVGVLQPLPDSRLERKFRLVGRVAQIDGPWLVLKDHAEGCERIESSRAFLEPRSEAVDWCVRHLLGSRAHKVLRECERNAAEFRRGPSRLEQIRKTLDYLRTKTSLDLTPGSKLSLGPLLEHSDQMFPGWEAIPKPTLIFDPSGTRTDVWNEHGIDENGPYDQRIFTPKELNIAVVCNASNEGQIDQFLAKFFDGLPEVRTGSGSWQRTPYAKGFVRRFNLQRPRIKYFTSPSNSATDYAYASQKALQTAFDEGFHFDLAIIQIEESFKSRFGNDSPYFVTKALFLKHQVPVQEIRRETMRLPDGQLVFILNNLSLASYAKVGGTPWLLASGPTVAHELVIGIGSHSVATSRIGPGERFVGITTVFTSDGRYLLSDGTAAVEFERYATELYETLKRLIEIVRRTDNWRSTDKVRLIFHVFKPLRDSEAEAVQRTVAALGIPDVSFAFLHIAEDHPFLIFDTGQEGFGTQASRKGIFGPERGLRVELGESEALVVFAGAREIKEERHGMPRPLLLRLHRLSTFRDMTYLARQAFNFSCNSWRMFSPEPVPITIRYSDLIAELLSGLREVSGWDIDVVRLGSIARKRWFL